ncbi:MAG TPA: hypothetical protein VKE24_10860 [Candidatus Acidoferrales bacterium]|nr:hypothetical protein [Candidatus Acidoferrales bacterium]
MKALASLLIALGLASALGAQTPGGRQTPPTRGRKAAAAPRKVSLVPQFVPGRVVRYQMDFRTTTETQRTGPVQDPQAPSQLEMAWGAVVRVEVLSVEPVPTPSESGSLAGGRGSRTRLRTTYEKVVATARSDTFDPEAAAIAEGYRKFEGHAVTFTLGADGKVSEVEGLEGVVTDPKAADAAHEWFAHLAIGASAPERGIAPGEKWSSEQAASHAPLAGLFWHTESTYLRDEQCRTTPDAAPGSPDAISGEPCAVLLTRFEVVQPKPPRDPTPEEYRKRGLRTAGKWTGSGETLSYISLQTGWMVSVTQSGTEEMDVTVSTADGESSVHYAGRVRSQSQITLLREPAVPAP